MHSYVCACWRGKSSSYCLACALSANAATGVYDASAGQPPSFEIDILRKLRNDLVRRICAERAQFEDVRAVANDSFGEQEPSCKFAVMTGRPHSNSKAFGDPRIFEPIADAHFERLFVCHMVENSLGVSVVYAFDAEAPDKQAIAVFIHAA